ncbi:ubiquitin-protein ligase Anaphase Promoting Complex [Naganishia albida]|nr:ubiquitin-protein ligase Anaphase Promoting Complex [Naganishia albida]
MKIIYKEYHPVASWRWDVDPDGGNRGPNVEDSQRAIPDGIPDEPGLVGDDGPARDEEDDDDDDDDDDDEDDEEMCGVCQQEFESACPACKVPGDDCPLIWGGCKHVFHMHCLLQWLQTPSSKEQCPLDRRPWVPL